MIIIIISNACEKTEHGIIDILYIIIYRGHNASCCTNMHVGKIIDTCDLSDPALDMFSHSNMESGLWKDP